MIKILATLAGLGLLGATAHVTVAASGGYASEHAPVVIAVAIGVAVGSVCIGKALSERRYVLAITMLACTWPAKPTVSFRQRSGSCRVARHNRHLLPQQVPNARLA